MGLDRIAPLHTVMRNRLYNPTTGHWDGDTVLQRDLECIRARRAGRLDALARRCPVDGWGPGVKALMLHDEYLAGYMQADRRRAHAARVKRECTPAGRLKTLVAARRQALCVLAEELAHVDPKAAADTRRAASALFEAWSKLHHHMEKTK